jgi:probable rRNA maturation factor
MILLDPDLEPESPPGRRPVREDPEPGPAAKKTSMKRAGAPSPTSNSKTKGRDIQLPSARTLARFLAHAQAAVRLKGQVTVLLTTDAAIRKLNRQFRGKNKATDVLSFPASGVGAEGMAGDLAISVTTAMSQAAEQGHSLATEIKVLVLHGLLHLAGFDHEVDDGKMARREKALRARLGLPLGLIERAENPSGAKAQGHSGLVNVRAKARTLHLMSRYAGAKARINSSGIVRGLKPPPPSVSRFSAAFKAPASSVDSNVRAKARTLHLTADYAGAKARPRFGLGSARLKSCPFKTSPKAGRV